MVNQTNIFSPKKKKDGAEKNYIFKKKIVQKQYSLLCHIVSDVHFFPPKYKPKKENLDKDRQKTRKCIKEAF